MKKFNVFLICGLVLFLSSCTADLGTEGEDTVTEDQLNDLANSSPEAALLLATGLEGGNNYFLNDFNTAGNGNIHDDFGHMAVNMGTDLMSNDNMMTQSHWFVNYYNYTARTEPSIRTNMIWKFYWKVIQNMNSGLLFAPADAEAQDIKYIRGRLLAMRGFAYFYLLRLYGNGELGLPVNTTEEVEFSRQPSSHIKEIILGDLTEAYTLLEGYQRSTKVIINQQIVAGFLARYYLEYGDYAQAAAFAAEARAGYQPMGQDQLFDGFNKITNTEWMWGADITTTSSTYYASFFSQMGNLNPGYAGLLQVYKCCDRRVYDAISATDARKGWFTDDDNPYGLPKYANIKFVDDTDFEGDYVFMRASEMYLIEAEAKALAGDEAGARQVLFDLVSTRDSGYVLSTKSGTALVNEIRSQRKLELWGEGFAFYDMKRTNSALERDYVGTNHNSLGFFNYPAGSPKFNFQIPIAEIQANPALGEQNPF